MCPSSSWCGIKTIAGWKGVSPLGAGFCYISHSCKAGEVASSVTRSQLACITFEESAFGSLSYGEQDDLMVSSDYFLRVCLLGPVTVMWGGTADEATCGTSNMRSGT